MRWLKKTKYMQVKAGTRREMPEGLWLKCPKGRETLYRTELEKNMWVCPKCNYHFRIGAKKRIELTVDDGTFVETDAHLEPCDPLEFSVKGKSYQDQITKYQEQTGLKEAAIIGLAKLENMDVSLAITDSSFMMGSMGSVVGEKVTRAVEAALDKKIPLISISGSGGGARMQEGIFSLMQMAKVNAALGRLAKEKLLYISIITDPTMGGVAASFATVGDIVIAEPGAMMGFAGARVIENTIREKLPDNFQSAEHQMECGFVDMVVSRHDMRDTLARVLHHLAA